MYQTKQEEQKLQIQRHSCAHMLAAAVQSLWPEAQFGVGPATETGFYYDLFLPSPLKEEDLAAIEKRMQQLANKKLAYVRSEVAIDDAIALMEKLKQPFKVELLQLLKSKGSTAIAPEEAFSPAVDFVSLYQTGAFTDLCRGPHVEHSGQIGVFKLRSIAGAYWRGNENNPQLQRIHALCYANAEDLEHALWQIEQAELRDHRKLGRELQLFAFSQDVGAGLPLWLPKGMVLRNELEQLAVQEERRAGYQRVSTPQITKEALYIRSGHLPYYAEDMYQPLDIDGEKYYLRPMNCPHHHQIYSHNKWSYRDLPIRLSEYGQVFRYEASGGLSGLMRTRGFCQNDAHIYCRPDQAKDEFLAVMRLHARYYDLLGIKEYYMRFSLPDISNNAKYADDPEGWSRAIAIIRQAMEESGYPYVEVPGEAAFYGPKVDFMIKSVIGTEYAISTNQLDFLAAKRFDLHYIAADGSEQTVYVIHRAPLGSHERFVAFLIEHYAGAFPVWLSPIQARIIPISDRHHAYAQQVYREIFDAPIATASGGARVDVDNSDERMQKKIRAAQQEKIPYMLVVGDKEMANSTVSVRLRSGQDLGTMTVAAFIERLSGEVKTRSGE